MSEELPVSTQILREACQRLNMPFQLVPGTSGFLARVGDDNKHFFFAGAGYPLNPTHASALVKNKYFTNHVLRRMGVRCADEVALQQPPHTHVWQAFVATHGYPLFVKPNTGSQSADVQRVENDAELVAAMEQIFVRHDTVLIQTAVRGREYRAFVIDGRVQYLSERAPLEGAYTISFTQDVPALLHDWAHAIAHECGLRVCAIDFFTTEDLADPATFTIGEINAHPSLRRIYDAGYHDVAVGIWQQILEKFFYE